MAVTGKFCLADDLSSGLSGAADLVVAPALLRASYRRSWNFPGGGIRPAEAPEQAARREFQEETGLLVPVLKAAGVVEGFWDNRNDKVHFFELRLERLPPLRIDHREIVEARLVSPGELGNMKLTGPVAAYFARARSG